MRGKTRARSLFQTRDKFGIGRLRAAGLALSFLSLSHLAACLVLSAENRESCRGGDRPFHDGHWREEAIAAHPCPTGTIFFVCQP